MLKKWEIMKKGSGVIFGTICIKNLREIKKKSYGNLGIFFLDCDIAYGEPGILNTRLVKYYSCLVPLFILLESHLIGISTPLLNCKNVLYGSLCGVGCIFCNASLSNSDTHFV